MIRERLCTKGFGLVEEIARFSPAILPACRGMLNLDGPVLRTTSNGVSRSYKLPVSSIKFWVRRQALVGRFLGLIFYAGKTCSILENDISVVP